MLTLQQLRSLDDALGGQRVLTVALDGESHDPASHGRWRQELTKGIRSWRHRLEGASRDVRTDFERAVELLLTAVEGQPGGGGDGRPGALSAPAWLGVATGDRVHLAMPLPVRVETHVEWALGMDPLPALPALRLARPVFLGMVDERHAVLERLTDGALHPVARLRADTAVDVSRHMGAPVGAGFHAGTRGATAHDTAQRSLTDASARMFRDFLDVLPREVTADAWLVLGGSAAVLPRFPSSLPTALAGRTTILQGLPMDASDAEKRAAAQRGAATRRAARDEALLAEVEAGAASGGRGATGAEATAEALARAQVGTLLLTGHHLREHAGEARAAVRAALGQGAEIEVLEGEAAGRLQTMGGIAAALRFRGGA